MSSAPAKELAALSLPSTRVAEGQLAYDRYFDKLRSGGWGTRRDLPKGVTLELEGIDPAYAVPMGSIAMHLNDKTYASPTTGAHRDIFGPGATLMLRLNLKKHGLADGNYRFTWTGTGSAGTVYVELVTVSGPAVQTVPTVKLPADQTEELKKGDPVPAGTRLVAGTATFELATQWAAERCAHLKRALELTPADALAVLDGVKFRIRSGKGPAGEDGHYLPEKHVIEMYESAWEANEARYGGAEWAVFAIAHEIGHAIDRAALRKAGEKHGAGKISDRQMAAARSESGGRWVQGRDGNWTDEFPLAGTEGDFRKAAAADGVKLPGKATTLAGGPTDYSNVGWEEMYADSWALYVTDPDLLKLIRPNLHGYFAKKYPRKP